VRTALSGAWLALLLVAAGPAAARHHRDAADAVPGNFDYYLLSLSWSPAFCLDSPQSAECRGPRRYGLIVHGLWPQREDGARLERCDVHERVDDRIADSMQDLMPATGLIYHEWSAHGTCSGLDPADFFALVRRARAEFTVPEALAGPAAPVTQRTATLLDQLRAANPRFPDGAIIVTCTGQDVPRLREVRACLDRDLHARRCAADVLRAACRAPQLLIPPLR
jgi:ribonuclease T2